MMVRHILKVLIFRVHRAKTIFREMVIIAYSSYFVKFFINYKICIISMFLSMLYFFVNF